MKIQIDFPAEYDKLLNLYKVTNDFETKAEAVVDLAIKGLKPEEKQFIQDNENKKSKFEHLIDRPEHGRSDT